MIEITQHFGYILASWTLAAIVLIGLVVSVVLDHRAQTRALARLEARGIRRRSAEGAEPEAPGAVERAS